MISNCIWWFGFCYECGVCLTREIVTCVICCVTCHHRRWSSSPIGGTAAWPRPTTRVSARKSLFGCRRSTRDRRNSGCVCTLLIGWRFCATRPAFARPHGTWASRCSTFSWIISSSTNHNWPSSRSAACTSPVCLYSDYVIVMVTELLKKVKAHHLYSATNATAAEAVLYVTDRAGVLPIGRRLSLHPQTLTCDQTAIRSPVLPFNDLHPHNPC